MPYLDWSNEPITMSFEEHPKLARLRVDLSRAQHNELGLELQKVYAEGGFELRVDFPRRWTIFFKAREEDSRLLLAHPEENAWVATVALTPAHGSRVVEKLNLGRAVKVGEHGPLNPLSNFTLEIGA
jgi:hypothetical protein